MRSTTGRKWQVKCKGIDAIIVEADHYSADIIEGVCNLVFETFEVDEKTGFTTGTYHVGNAMNVEYIFLLPDTAPC